MSANPRYTFFVRYTLSSKNRVLSYTFADEIFIRLRIGASIFLVCLRRKSHDVLILFRSDSDSVFSQKQEVHECEFEWYLFVCSSVEREKLFIARYTKYGTMFRLNLRNFADNCRHFLIKFTKSKSYTLFVFSLLKLKLYKLTFRGEFWLLSTSKLDFLWKVNVNEILLNKFIQVFPRDCLFLCC